jgi:hypothetical protein
LRKLFLALLPSILSATLSAQEVSKGINSPYPQDYFRNPLEIPIFLAGNFGECRPGHFHSGVDIKTKGEENQPVHAAADGYISRIKMEKSGFGHALYITHPNGYTTLYAHLNDFAPAIQKYLHRSQYDRQRWDVDLQLSPAQFPVKKGDLIAWSGNTGGSTAPHLHFEIRNTKTEHPLNPELFGLPIEDKIPPTAAEVVLYYPANADLGFYENNRVFVSLAQKSGAYKPKGVNDPLVKVAGDTIITYPGTIAIGINADDYMDGSDNTLAFYTARLFVDDVLQSQVTLDDIGYDVSRYINAYADYKTRQQLRKWEQCIFRLPGNRLDNIYTYLNAANGRVTLLKGRTYKIVIVLTDDKGNESTVSFFASATAEPAPVPVAEKGIHFFAAKPNRFANDQVSFELDNRQLYDDIWFDYRSAPANDVYSDKFNLHYPYVPVHHYFDLNLKPNKPIPAELKDKVAMIYSDGKDEDGRAAVATDNSWYKAAVRNFGTYWLDIDTIPPTIKSLQKNGAILSKAKQITFEVKDAMTSVKTFSGYIDGKWVCFEQHGKLFFYKFDERCPRGKHELTFKAEDENGNARSVKLKFTR